MKNNNRFLVFALGLIILAVLTVSPGCTQDGIVRNPGHFRDLLEIIPASVAGDMQNGRSWIVAASDYARIRRTYGITIPSSSDRKSKLNYMMALLRDPAAFGGPFISGIGQYTEITPVNKQNLGFDLFDVDASFEFGINDISYQGLIGRFDPKATQDALDHQDAWQDVQKDNFTAEAYHGVLIYSWAGAMALR